MSTRVVRDTFDERTWLARAVVVLQSPRAVFEALRDDRDEPARAREEAVLALVLLAGIAGILWTAIAGRLMDDPAIDGILVAVWAFIGGGIYGVAVYWASGFLLWVGMHAAGADGSYRQARHVLAYATAPIALSLLLVWPVRLAVYGGDLFETGGADHGAGDLVFTALEIVLVAWAVGLLVVGVRTVYRWTWPRALLACLLAAALPGLVLLGSALF